MNNQFGYLFKHRVLENGFLEIVARWVLGLTFIYASYYKILAPGEFAKMVYGYGLFPSPIINVIAIIVPFVELFAGLALIIGGWTRSATLIINALLVLFIVFISINLIRGHEFDCGCFAADDYFSAAKPWQTLIRDVVLLSAGWYVYQFKARRWLAISK